MTDALLEIRGLTWNVTPDLLGILDDAGFFIEINPAWRATLGWERDEILSRTFFEFLHPDDIGDNIAAFSEIKTGTPILNFENRYRHKDGSYRWLSWNAVPEGGNYFCSARDITQSKENAASLKSREQEAILREQFVAVLGHDLRNPLASIRSAMNMMRKEKLSPRSTDMVQAVDKSVDRMAALISDVLDFARSKLGSGLEISALADHDPDRIIAQAADEIALSHPDRVIERDLAFAGTIRCNEVRLSQLASNLLGNAVRHGDPTQPARLETWRDAETFVLKVTNCAPDIPAEKLETIFEPFHSADPEPLHKGLGLGLFIVAQIAQAHGGRMKVTSRNGLTAFEFSMPIHHQDLADPSPRDVA